MTSTIPSSSSQDQTFPFTTVMVRVSQRQGAEYVPRQDGLYPLTAAGVTVGRTDGDRIILNDTGIAPTHLLLRGGVGEAFVRVMSAKKETRLNGQRLESKEYIWWLRDQLDIGDYRLELILPAQQANGVTGARAEPAPARLTAVGSEPIAIDAPPLVLVPGTPSIWPIRLALVSGQSAALRITLTGPKELHFVAPTQPFTLEPGQEHCEEITVEALQRPDNLPGEYQITCAIETADGAQELVTRNLTWVVKPFLLAPALQLDGTPQRVHTLHLPLLPPKWKDGTAAYTIRLTNRSNVREYYVVTIKDSDASLRFQPESHTVRLEPGITTPIPLTVTQLSAEPADERYDSDFSVRVKPDNQPAPDPAPGRYTLLSRRDQLRQLRVVAGLLIAVCLVLLALFLVSLIAQQPAVEQQQTAIASAIAASQTASAMSWNAANPSATPLQMDTPASTLALTPTLTTLSQLMATQVMTQVLFARNQAVMIAGQTNTAIALVAQTTSARDITATGIASGLNQQVSAANTTVAAAYQQVTQIAQVQTAVAGAQQKVDQTAVAESGKLDQTRATLNAQATTQAQATPVPLPDVTGLVFSSSPLAVKAGQNFNVAVSLVSDNGQVVPIDNVIVTLSIADASAPALKGNPTAHSQKGVANFQKLMITKAGAWHLHASVNDKQTAQNLDITVAVGPVDHYQILERLPSSVTSGGRYTLAFQAEDRFHNKDESYNQPFLLQITQGVQVAYSPKSFSGGAVVTTVTITAPAATQGVLLYIEPGKIRSPTIGPFTVEPPVFCKKNTCP